MTHDKPSVQANYGNQHSNIKKRTINNKPFLNKTSNRLKLFKLWCYQKCLNWKTQQRTVNMEIQYSFLVKKGSYKKGKLLDGLRLIKRKLDSLWFLFLSPRSVIPIDRCYRIIDLSILYLIMQNHLTNAEKIMFKVNGYR